MSRLSGYPLFAGVSRARLAALDEAIVSKTYPSGRAVFMEDTWGNAVYLLESGWVRVRQTSKSGTLTLAILGPKAMFGEMAILDAVPRSTDVLAITDVHTLIIPAPKFQELWHSDLAFTCELTRQLAQRLRQSNYRRYLQKHPPAVRLVATLVNLTETYGKGDPPEILAIPTQDLADLADTTPEVVEKGLERLKQEGLLSQSGSRWLLPKLDRLVQMVQAVA
ncbi:MAG: Crp/Fnr family transcriptional regulator [Thermostichales cyanobacterium SZTDM-1c_bins_54]